MFKQHPLHGCHRRIQRADRHIKECDSLLRQFATDCEEYLASTYNEETGKYGILVEFPDSPEDLPLAISDAVHSLRAALDYLVYELALKDSGTIQNGTQFPLETDKLGTLPNGNKFGFDMVVDRFLRGVSQPHRNAIELSQPYNGVRWTKLLKDISNPDKHRKLTTIKIGNEMHGWTRHDGKGTKLPTGETIQVDPTQMIVITLEDRSVTILDTLYGIQAGVIDTVNAFYSELKV